jgi:hypothetical protein
MKARMTTKRALLLLLALGAFSLAACVPGAGHHDKFANAISNDGLARLRACESGGNYSITNPSGAYRGAYQFSQSTWNGVARAHYPWLVGVDPARAAPHEQDMMARALWATGGRGHWPHCGLRV